MEMSLEFILQLCNLKIIKPCDEYAVAYVHPHDFVNEYLLSDDGKRIVNGELNITNPCPIFWTKSKDEAIQKAIYFVIHTMNHVLVKNIPYNTCDENTWKNNDLFLANIKTKCESCDDLLNLDRTMKNLDESIKKHWENIRNMGDFGGIRTSV